MTGLLDSAEIDVPCPGCGHQAKKTIGWLKSHDQIVCAGCGQTIDLHDVNFRKNLAEAERMLSDFMKDFK